MKKIILILLLFSFYFGYTQTGEVKPITCKQLQTPNNVTFYFNIGDSAFWARLGSYGEMRIISKYYADRYLVPYNNANRDVDLNTHSIIAKGQNLPLHIGVAVMPTHIKNVDGTVTLGNDGVFNFSKNTDGSSGIIQKAITVSSTITLTDGVVNFIYADYNSGNPIYTSTLDNKIFKDDFTKIPVIRATREGTTVHFEEYDLYGILLANKLMIKDVYINGGRRWTGLILSTIPTRKSIVSSGSAIFAVQYYDNMSENIAGTSGLMYEYYLSGGVWNKIQRTSYDASYYSDGINRLSLNNSYWVSKYFWRDIGDDNEVYFVHGNQYNKESDAVNELLPAAPSVMTAHTVYVGKIVIQKDATNGVAYPRVWEGAIQNAGVRNHSDLSPESLVWNNSGHTGTINTIAGFDSGGLATNVTLTKESVGLGNVTNDAQVKRTEMGANNGVATLDAGGKVPFSQLPASLMIYKGIWSALTNTPTLTDGVGTAGWVYRANLSGSVNFGSGPISFYPGDWVIYNGSTWERSVGTDNVVSVNGQQGVVVLNTSHIAENTNLYYTDARSRASISENITGIDYNNTTGIFSQTSGYGIPTTTQISQIHPQGTDIQAPTLVGDLIGLTQTTTIISIAGKEDKSNKVTSISGSSTDTQYPSAKLLYDQLALKAPASGSGSYIWASPISPQNANIWISGRAYFGATKSHWWSGYTSVGQFGGISIVDYSTTQQGGIYHNSYYDGVLEKTFLIRNGAAQQFYFNNNGSLYYYNSNIGTAGSEITPTLKFSIDNTGAATLASTIQATTAKLTNLTDGYIPYHISDASGLVNSPIYTDGNITRIGNNAGTAQVNIASYFEFDENSILTYDRNLAVYKPLSLRSSYFTINPNDSEAVRVTSSGNVGIGYSTGTEITNNKLAVNGGGYFNGTLNSTGYLLNGNNLFSSLSTNAAAKWDGTKFINLYNPTVQTLSGTTPNWNVSNGVNAKITLSGNTTITLSNLIAGTTGNITITNPSTSYIVTLSGYTNKISQTIYYASNQFYTSGGSKIDVYSWYYDGTYLIWNGGLDYK